MRRMNILLLLLLYMAGCNSTPECFEINPGDCLSFKEALKLANDERSLEKLNFQLNQIELGEKDMPRGWYDNYIKERWSEVYHKREKVRMARRKAESIERLKLERRERNLKELETEKENIEKENRAKIIKQNNYHLFYGEIFQHVSPTMILGKPEISDIDIVLATVIINLSANEDQANALLEKMGFEEEAIDFIDRLIPHVKMAEIPKIYDDLVSIELPLNHYVLQKPDGYFALLLVKRDGLFNYLDVTGATRTVAKYKVVTEASK